MFGLCVLNVYIFYAWVRDLQRISAEIGFGCLGSSALLQTQTACVICCMYFGSAKSDINMRGDSVR